MTFTKAHLSLYLCFPPQCFSAEWSLPEGLSSCYSQCGTCNVFSDCGIILKQSTSMFGQSFTCLRKSFYNILQENLNEYFCQSNTCNMIRMPQKTVITPSMKKSGEKKKSKRDIYTHVLLPCSLCIWVKDWPERRMIEMTAVF